MTIGGTQTFNLYHIVNSKRARTEPILVVYVKLLRWIKRPSMWWVHKESSLFETSLAKFWGQYHQPFSMWVSVWLILGVSERSHWLSYLPNAWIMTVSSRLTDNEKERKQWGVGENRMEAGRRKGKRKEEGGKKGPTSLGTINNLWRMSRRLKKWMEILGPEWTSRIRKPGNTYRWLLRECIIFNFWRLY